MDIHLLTILLGWSTLINYILLMIWWLLLTQAQDWFHQIHLKTMHINITKEAFQSAHYMLMGVFEIIILVFNLVPFLILWVVF